MAEQKTQHGLSDYDQLMEWVNRRSTLLSLRDGGGFNVGTHTYYFTSHHRDELRGLNRKINAFHVSTHFAYA